MCGLAGIVRFDAPATHSRDAVAKLCARLRHRGPDGTGQAEASFAALGHTRLAMLDPANGAQPFRSEDGRFLLVYNGELYNHRALRSRLRGPFRTNTDTETLLRAWETWGEGCVAELDGMFSFFIWDELRKRGFAVRDRLGVKPFWFIESPFFAFASEAKALLPLLSARRVNVAAAVEYLVAAPFSGVARSPFEGIRPLLPGHLLQVDAGGIQVRRYWQWKPDAANRLDPPEAARAVREALESGVRASLEADAPLGIFLSGGLDSTAIAAMASATGARLPSFTLTFDGDARVERDSSRLVISDDEPYARSAAAGLDLPLREAHLSCADIAAELKAVARVDDALPAWEQELSQRTLARVASRSVKGVLVGDAADETHYGYHFLLDEEATQHPSVILRRLGAVPIRRDVDPDPVGSCSREYTALAEEAGATFGPGEGGLTAMTHLIVRRWLPRLLHNGDIHCMAFGLEPRVPFCSSSLVELAQRVSAPDATARGVEKSILREALRGVVPEDVRLRKKSALPKHQRVDEVYRREAAAVARDPHALVHALVDVERLAPLLTKPRLTEPERAQLFRVICLHHWASSWEVQPP